MSEFILDPVKYTSPANKYVPRRATRKTYYETVLIRELSDFSYGPIEGYIAGALHIDTFHSRPSNKVYDALQEGKKVRVRIQFVEVVEEDEQRYRIT